MPRGKSNAQKRLALDQVVNRKESPLDSLDAAVAAAMEYIPGAIETLGKAAAEGNADAAKKLLDFVTAAKRDEAGGRAKDILERIATIRGRSAQRPDSP